jgi:hypothetical protein
MKRMLLGTLLFFVPGVAAAQSPAQAGQDAYAAIAEVVRLLEADPSTDWSKVNLEALRQHLIDMNDVTLRSSARQTTVPGGAKFEVTGEGRTTGAIRRMLASHARMLGQLPAYEASVAEMSGGVLLTVRAKRSGDNATEARIRGLGFIGLLTVGAHHATHHLALARGDAMAHEH